MMQKYEVGKIFPGTNPAPGHDNIRADLTTSFFDVVAWMSDLEPNEITDWKRGKLKYGIWIKESIPFIIFKFKNWSFDVNINILKVKNPDEMDKWLNTEGNLITLFLIDTKTNILKAMRAVSISLSNAEKIKDILEMQTHEYADQNQVDVKIDHILSNTPTEVMLKETKTFEI